MDDGRVLAEEQFPHGLQHAAQVIPIIDRLCRAQGWGPSDVEQVYVSAGPGSFTGLRIGITVAKTLALVRGVKVVAVPTARVLVENAPEQAHYVVIVLDAKREQIFTARFERVGETWEERDPAHVDSLAEMLKRSPRPVHLLGEGMPYHRKYIPDSSDVIVTDEDWWRPRASAPPRIASPVGNNFTTSPTSFRCTSRTRTITSRA